MSDDGEAPVLVELRAGHGLVPLQSMNVLLTVEQYVAQVEVVTRFVNNENNPVEAVYVLLLSFHHYPQNAIVFILPSFQLPFSFFQLSSPQSLQLHSRFHFQQEDTCIYEFKVETGGRVLVSVCKEKEEAANKYDDAIAGGHGAYMLTKGI